MLIRIMLNMGFWALVRGSSDFFLHGLVSLIVLNFPHESFLPEYSLLEHICHHAVY